MKKIKVNTIPSEYHGVFAKIPGRKFWYLRLWRDEFWNMVEQELSKGRK